MLSKFPNKTLKVGAKVSLSPESKHITENRGYGRGPYNPVGIEGVVVDTGSFYLRVRWPTTLKNIGYRNDEYDLIAEGEPGYLETT